MMMRAARLLPPAQSPAKLVVSSKGGECRREVDETGKRDTTKKAKILESTCSLWRLKWRLVARTSRPRHSEMRSEYWSGSVSVSRASVSHVIQLKVPVADVILLHLVIVDRLKQLRLGRLRKLPVAEWRRLHQPTSKVDAEWYWPSTAQLDGTKPHVHMLWMPE